MNSKTDPKISVVVPLHNEEGNVTPLAKEIFAALNAEAGNLELILVDDASEDRTWEKVEELCKGDGRVRGLRHGARAGQSAALWTGFRASRGEILLTLDGDLQNDPADLPRLLSLLTECDLACGVRVKRMDDGLRRISSSVARSARWLVLRSEFRDTGCNLRAFKRWVLETIPPFNGFHRFMPIFARNGGAQVREAPVSHRPRVSGKSNYGMWNRMGRGIYDLLMVRWYLKRQLKRVAVTEMKSSE